MSAAQDMEALLWANGCDIETARFAARMLTQNGYALVTEEYLSSIGTPFASIHSHEEACERLRRINSSTYSGAPSKQVLPERHKPPLDAALALPIPGGENTDGEKR